MRSGGLGPHVWAMQRGWLARASQLLIGLSKRKSQISCGVSKSKVRIVKDLVLCDICIENCCEGDRVSIDSECCNKEKQGRL